jgi:hypothetical protein
MTGKSAVTICAAEVILRRIRSEYVEMPGLSLTPSQAQRLWSLPSEECEVLLEQLVVEGFLRRTDRGTFVKL